jgi:hypothetical protein
MEKPKVISLGEKRKEKENARKRDGVSATPNGYFRYPEEKIDITVDEALKLAKEVVENYSDPEKLFADFAERERANSHRGDMELGDNELKKEMEADLKTQRSFAAVATMEGLLKVFALHAKKPNHYYGVMLLACAEELKKRFEPPVS